MKSLVIETTVYLVRSLNTIDNEPGDCIFRVYKAFIRKLTD